MAGAAAGYWGFDRVLRRDHEVFQGAVAADQAGFPRSHTARRLQGGGADRPIPITARKQPMYRLGQAPIGTQDRQQRWRQHDVAVLAALAVFDPDHHPAAVDVGDLECGNLGYAQPGAVVKAARLRRPHTAWRKRVISSALSTTGSFFGSLALTMRSNASCRPSVTPKKKRSAHDTWLMCDHDIPRPAKWIW